jgi:hypothetical protein
MQRARMAQIRRDPASEVLPVSPRRDFRPTGSWVSYVHSPFAHSLLSDLLSRFAHFVQDETQELFNGGLFGRAVERDPAVLQ